MSLFHYLQDVWQGGELTDFLSCFRIVRHFFPNGDVEAVALKRELSLFPFLLLQKCKFGFCLNLKWEMNDLVLCSILVAMSQSYAELVWTDSSSFLLSSMAEPNWVDYAAVILLTWLNFSVYLWVSTNTLCILLPCIECFYFPLI